jgi:hypothetical protein
MGNYIGSILKHIRMIPLILLWRFGANKPTTFPAAQLLIPWMLIFFLALGMTPEMRRLKTLKCLSITQMMAGRRLLGNALSRLVESVITGGWSALEDGAGRLRRVAYGGSGRLLLS